MKAISACAILFIGWPCRLGLIGFVTAWLVLALSGAVMAQKIDEAQTDRQHAWPVIVLDQAQPDIFPASWLAPPIVAKATLLDEKERQCSRDIVDRALAKYPAGAVTDHLRKVYVVGRLEYFGVPTGGTNSLTAVYLANNGKYRSEAIEAVFHAEFSSILLRDHPQHLDKAAWQRINPPDFHYLGNGVQAIKQGQAGQRLDAALNAEGFVVEYAKSNLENDFNSIADRLFTGDAAFWHVAEQHPKVMAKAELVIAFYTKLDASFTRERFLSFRRDQPGDSGRQSSDATHKR